MFTDNYRFPYKLQTTVMVSFKVFALTISRHMYKVVYSISNGKVYLYIKTLNHKTIVLNKNIFLSARAFNYIIEDKADL